MLLPDLSSCSNGLQTFSHPGPKNWGQFRPKKLVKESAPLEQALPSSRENLSQCIDLWQGKCFLEKTRLNPIETYVKTGTLLVMQHMHLHQSLKSKGDYGWDTWISESLPWDPSDWARHAPCSASAISGVPPQWWEAPRNQNPNPQINAIAPNFAWYSDTVNIWVWVKIGYPNTWMVNTKLD